MRFLRFPTVQTRIALAFAAAIAVTDAAGASEILNVRFGVTSATETRVVIDATGPLTHAFNVKSDQPNLALSISGGDPAATLALEGKGAGQVARYALSGGGIDPLVLTLSMKSPATAKAPFLIAPREGNPNFRLVIDLVAAAKPAPVAAAEDPMARAIARATIPAAAPKAEPAAKKVAKVDPPPVSAPLDIPTIKPTATKVQPASTTATASARPYIAPPTLSPTPRPVIVIDAGHGGTDPGAAGPAGEKESEATLLAAQKLAEILRASKKYKVVLTRDADKRLAHEERSRIARDARADLFISLHADAHAEPSVRGASVYTLSEEGSARSAREAQAKGDFVLFDVNISEADPRLGGILFDIAQADTETQSDRFAETLVGRLKGATPMLNNSHRRANFKVLLAPDVPAVLLELAFISNKSDAANLFSPAWRNKSMAAVAGAIDAYFAAADVSLEASNRAAATPTR